MTRPPSLEAAPEATSRMTSRQRSVGISEKCPIFIPSQAIWVYRPANGGPDVFQRFGPTSGVIPVPADYGGDGKVDLAVYILATSTFAYRPSRGGPDVIQQFGPSGSKAIAVPADYEGATARPTWPSTCPAWASGPTAPPPAAPTSSSPSARVGARCRSPTFRLPAIARRLGSNERDRRPWGGALPDTSPLP
jgi:hypothetical protein